MLTLLYSNIMHSSETIYAGGEKKCIEFNGGYVGI